MAKTTTIKKQQAAAGVQPTNIKYNSRTAEANAQTQDASHVQNQLDVVEQDRADLLAKHQAGEITTDEYNRTNAVLTSTAQRYGTAAATNAGATASAQQQLAGSATAYGNQAQGFGTSYTPNQQGVIDPKTGQVFRQQSDAGAYGLSGNGELQQSAIDNIKKQHPEWTDAQVMQQINSQQPGIRSTMSDSGQNVQYDANGVTIPGSAGTAFRNEPSQQNAANIKAASDAEIAGIKGYSSVPIYNKDGQITGYNKVEDPAETVRLQQEAKNAAKTKAAADATYAASLNTADTKGGASVSGSQDDIIEPNPDSFLSGLDALEQQYAGTTMAPLFQFYKGQYADLQAKGLRGENLMAEIQKRTDKYVVQQQGDMSAMQKAWGAMYDSIEQSQLESAARTYDQQTRLAQQQKEKDELAYQQAIRDQEIKNDEDRQSLLLGNGISGGWRSSMHTAKMIDSFKKAENIVADLKSEKINKGDVWANKLIDIEQNFHSNITAAHDNKNVNLLTLQDKLQARASELDKTVFSNDVEQMKMVNGLTDMWYDGVSKIAGDVTNQVTQINKDTQSSIDKAKDDLRQDQNQILSEEARHISQYGDTNPQGWSVIQNRKTSLGLSSSPNLPSLAQQDKMQKQQLASQSQALITDPRSTVSGTNYGLLGSNAFSSTKYSADEVARGLGNIGALIKAGKIQDAQHQILNYTRQGMGIGQQEQVTSQDNLINEIGYMKGEMSQYSPTFGAFWNTLAQSGKPLVGMQKDPEYVDFVSHVQRVLGEERHRLFGAALTGNENAQADSYLFNPAIDTAETLTRKLTNLEEIARRSRANRYDEILGSGAYTKLTGEKIKAPNATPSSGAQDTPEKQNQELLDFWNNPTGQIPSFNSPQPEGGKVSGNITSTTIGDRKVTGDSAATAAMEAADAEFFAATGKHIFVNSSYRSAEQQQAAYDRFLRGEISRAAPPGKSLHEKGTAFDITNWKEAEEYLIRHGFNPLPKNIRSSDPAHFSFGSIG